MTIIEDIDEFFFRLPLYEERQLPPNKIFQINLYGRALQELSSGTMRIKTTQPIKITDGYCPFCGRPSTFNIIPNGLSSEDWNNIESRVSLDTVRISCARVQSHQLVFHYQINRNKIVKYGQIPSLADIANDEARTYAAILGKQDIREFHRAIGLAAHGVGIGSFVYLRRIFERLVVNRFDEFKISEGWTDDQLPGRMDDRIEFLRNHLPSFLVENKKLYSILSKGIHELSEDACLAAFEPIRLSIKIILEEDKRKKEELEIRKKAADAIAKFESGMPPKK